MTHKTKGEAGAGCKVTGGEAWADSAWASMGISMRAWECKPHKQTWRSSVAAKPKVCHIGYCLTCPMPDPEGNKTCRRCAYNHARVRAHYVTEAK